MKLSSALSLCLVLSSSAACARSSPAATMPEASKDPAACTNAVRQSIAREFAGASITGCKAETANGREQFEVTLDHGAHPMEVDVAPDGTILQTEMEIPTADVPATVKAAFSARYPGAETARAEKQVRSGKGTFYELKFDAKPRAKEVTFAEDGTFVEEE